MDGGRHPSTEKQTSPRSRKRQRQKLNHQRREMESEALTTFLKHPSIPNALKAWIAHLHNHTTTQEVKSARKFAQGLEIFIQKASGSRTQGLSKPFSADILVQGIDSLAWSLNSEYTLKYEGDRRKNPTGRICANFRSLITFLASRAQGAFGNTIDIQYLQEECDFLEDDLTRTAKVNLIMEEYTSYVQEHSTDLDLSQDPNLDWVEYEVERIHVDRTLTLRVVESEENSFVDEPLRVKFPSTLTEIVKLGDIITLQLYQETGQNLWLPYMYSGFTPTREETEETPRDTRVCMTPSEISPPSLSAEDAISALGQRLRRTNISPARFQPPLDEGPGDRREDLPSGNEMRISFDESRFTEDYFRHYEGDIDSDEDWNSLNALGQR